MLHLVVDAANVVGSRPDGWWRDRAGAARRLAGSIVAVLVSRPEDLVELLDGTTPDSAETAGSDLAVAAVQVHLVLEGAAGAVEDLPTHPLLDVVHAPADGDSAIVDLVGRHEAAVQHALEHRRRLGELLLLDQHIAEEFVDLVGLERRLLLRRLGLLDLGECSVPLLVLHRLLRLLQRLSDSLGRHLVGWRVGCLRSGCRQQRCSRKRAHGKRQRQRDISCSSHDDSCCKPIHKR